MGATTQVYEAVRQCARTARHCSVAKMSVVFVGCVMIQAIMRISRGRGDGERWWHGSSREVVGAVAPARDERASKQTGTLAPIKRGT
jgi:hypothetical protein